MNRVYALLAVLALAGALALCSVATAQDATPLADGRYAVSEAVARDYVVCATEADLLRHALASESAVVDTLLASSTARAAETVHLRRALADGDTALAACSARTRVAQADAETLRRDLRAASRSRARWRTLATLGPIGALVAGVAAGILLSR